MRRLVTRPSASRAGTSNSDLRAQERPQRACILTALLGCPGQRQGIAGACIDEQYYSHGEAPRASWCGTLHSLQTRGHCKTV